MGLPVSGRPIQTLRMARNSLTMRILIAGATGAIGRPLVRCLKENRHSVFALARSPKSSRAVAELGAESVIADALDAASVKAAVAQVRPDAIINELTSLPRHYTAEEMKAAAERDHKVRSEGNANLLVALRNVGVRRYCYKARAFGTHRALVSLTSGSRSLLMRRPPSLPAHADTPNSKQRHRVHRVSRL